MKNTFRLNTIFIILLSGFILKSCCKKDKFTIPVLETTTVTEITATTAISGGSITDDGGAPLITCGVCWSTGNEPTISNSRTLDAVEGGNFTSHITGLEVCTIYCVRAYATNNVGTGYGKAVFFTTMGQAPTAITLPALKISTTGATLNGTVNANYLSTVIIFEYGISTTYGKTITAIQSPLTGTTDTTVSVSLIDSYPGTTYHYRVKAINSLGTVYGNDMTFTSKDLFADMDGNLYNSVTIGTQVWMKDNLKTTKYNDGTAIPWVIDEYAWRGRTTPGYCWADDNEAYKNPYGALYNWYAVNTGKLCPTRWHVPSDAEWTILTSYLGGESVAGGKLKEIGTAHWKEPNTGATNEVGFTALPGEFRDFYGSTTGPLNGYWGRYWSSTEYSSIASWHRTVFYDKISIDRGFIYKQSGFSVRCLIDY